GVSTGLASKAKSFGVYWFRFLALHQNGRTFHVLSAGTICGALASILPFTVSNFGAISLARFLLYGQFSRHKFSMLVWLSKFGDRILC
ncbi:hypothetical protein, partial [Vibrio parahaemolyticus]|uniref:hypothetical protein n=1 Tax=Vibrio parahaemolyticus TaxID=670 RepID=UPI001C5DAB9E